MLEAGVQLDGDVVTKRAVGIGSLNDGADRYDALDCIRLCLSLPPKKTTFEARFTKAFRDADPSFPSSNVFERQILAGVAVVEMLEKGNDISDVAALGLLTTSLQGTRAMPGSIPLGDLSRRYLDDKSQRIRKAGLIDVERRKLARLLDESKAVFAEPPALPFSQALEKILRGVVRAVEAISKDADRQSEETEILWWLFSESSRDMGIRVADMAPLAAAVVLGAELAELTQLPPGIFGASGMLGVALARNAKIEGGPIGVAEAVNALPRTWRDTAPASSDDATPLLLGIKKSLETDGTEDWIPAYKKAARFEALPSVPALALATQSYHERMLLRKLAEK